MIVISNYRRINKVAVEYKKIVDRKHKDMWHLVKSLEFSCKWHKRYVDDRIPKHYDMYKPGSLIFVDFGINIGSEFSKPHFAITLNKNDNKRNGNITVIPLTSKTNNHVLGINDSIFNNTIKHLTSNLTSIDESVSKYRKELSETNKQIVKTAKDFSLNTEDKTAVELCLEMIGNVDEFEDDAQKIINDHTEDLLKNLGRVQAKLTEQKKSRELVKDVLKQYNKYDKKSFVAFKNIQTISKLRVKKINRFDPSGSIQIAKSTFEDIREITLDYIF